MISFNDNSDALPEEFAEALALDQTLYDRVVAAGEQRIEDEFQIRTCLSVARQVLADSMEWWVKQRSEAVEKKVVAGAMMNDALGKYVDLVERISRIDKNMSERISVHNVFAVFRQMERIMDRELRRHVDPEIAGRIKRILQHEVKVPGRTIDNNDVEAPRITAEFMDATIAGAGDENN